MDHEIKALRSLDSNYIVKLVGAFERNDGSTILVMPLYDGNLSHLLKSENGFSEEDIKTIFHQLYLALKEMHSKGWAHRDLKLSNILYVNASQNITIKLTDFGFATRNEKSNLFCGTRGYQSLECSRRSYDTKKNDAWGLTMILLKMVTKKQHYIQNYLAGNTPSEVANRFKISEPFASVLLKVFVPENERIELDDFYQIVKKIEHLRPQENSQREEIK